MSLKTFKEKCPCKVFFFKLLSCYNSIFLIILRYKIIYYKINTNYWKKLPYSNNISLRLYFVYVVLIKSSLQQTVQPYNAWAYNAWGEAADKTSNTLPIHRLSLRLQLPSKSVFNSLYAMVKYKSCVQSISRFQSNLRVISKAFHSILSFPCIWLAGRPASGGRLLNWFLVSLLAAVLAFLWEFTFSILWLWNYSFLCLVLLSSGLWLWFM